MDNTLFTISDVAETAGIQPAKLFHWIYYAKRNRLTAPTVTVGRRDYYDEQGRAKALQEIADKLEAKEARKAK